MLLQILGWTSWPWSDLANLDWHCWPWTDIADPGLTLLTFEWLTLLTLMKLDWSMTELGWTLQTLVWPCWHWNDLGHWTVLAVLPAIWQWYQLYGSDAGYLVVMLAIWQWCWLSDSPAGYLHCCLPSGNAASNLTVLSAISQCYKLSVIRWLPGSPAR